jgi:hypothetical protein
MFIACWIPKATNTRLEYAILIAFTLPKLLYECAPMFCYIYIARLVSLSVKSTCPNANEMDPTDENFCEDIRKVLLSVNNTIQKLDELMNGAPYHKRREKYNKPRIYNRPLLDEPSAK